MKIAFVSTRGIPNNYGGFEQFAQYISTGLVAKGHDVVVYSPHFHPYQEDSYKGVRIKHIHSPEQWMGSSVGSFFYDFRCLKDALKNEHFDIIYEAGYTSIIPAFIWFNVKSRRDVIVTTNMDGLEYRRTKFNPLIRRFILWEEKMAVRHSHFLISDNMGIHDYYKSRYGKESEYLAYGAEIPSAFSEDVPALYGLSPDNYYLIIARMEPENNIDMAIEGFLASTENGRRPLVIVGKTTTPFAKSIIKKYGDCKNVIFPGGIYDNAKLNSLRKFSRAYFHGHSVGGTNPSLLEAMAGGCFILSHDNIFNRSVLSGNALYYKTSADVTRLLDSMDETIAAKEEMTAANLDVIRENYSWEKLVERHENYFERILNRL